MPIADSHPDKMAAENAATKLQLLRERIHSVIFGQEKLVDLVITGMLAQGHLLLEGLPGLGKTELVKTFSKALQIETRRVQFTPDLLPGDITGNPMLQDTPEGRRFVFEKGPVFTQLLLADEINRASPKVQSALLEAMQERKVTVMGESHPLPKPFFVFATQNPIELEGTYPLPEAQVDRFLFKLDVHRVDADILERIVNHRQLGRDPEVQPVLDERELLEMCELSSTVYLPGAVAAFIAKLVNATHPGESEAATGVRFGTSPRAAIGLAAASRAHALLDGRPHVGFEDVHAVAAAVLQHRILLQYEARIEGRTGASVVAALLEEVKPERSALPTNLREAKL